MADVSKKAIVLYPNPINDVLSFSEEISNIKITDISGKVINEISTKTKSINVSNFVKGVYFVTATTNSGKMISNKIVKE